MASGLGIYLAIGFILAIMVLKYSKKRGGYDGYYAAGACVVFIGWPAVIFWGGMWWFFRKVYKIL